MKKFLGVFASLFFIAALVGCGSKGPQKPDGLPELFPCTVALTNGGAPVDGAIVTLCAPDGGESKWTSSGVTNASGVAEIVTYGNFPGAPAGKYKVAAMKTEAVVETNPMGIDATNNGVYQASDVGVDKKYNYATETPARIGSKERRNERVYFRNRIEPRSEIRIFNP